MTLDYLFAWMMVLLRSLGVILQLPVIAGRPIPVPVQVALCMCLATLLAGIVPAAPMPLSLTELAVASCWDVILGLALGFVVRFTFAAVEMAGRIMTTEIGLIALPGMGAPEPAHEPLAALLSTFALVLFFLLGAHQWVIGALARRFVGSNTSLAAIVAFCMASTSGSIVSVSKNLIPTASAASARSCNASSALPARMKPVSANFIASMRSCRSVTRQSGE